MIFLILMVDFQPLPNARIYLLIEHELVCTALVPSGGIRCDTTRSFSRTRGGKISGSQAKSTLTIGDTH